MNGLTFHSPIWFWGLLALIPLLALRLWSGQSGRRQLRGLVSPRLHHQLVSSRGRAQRWTVFFLQLLALAATLAALARPQLGFDEVVTEIEARNLFLAIDTSRSMLANDLRPSRLSRAKLAATDIVNSLPEDRIGLIAFAGRPFLQAPLTVDHEAILEAVTQLDTEIIPRGGTNIAAAISLALDTIKEAEVSQSALVIFSDGEALEGSKEVAEAKSRAREAKLSIISVGVGTNEGSIIPELDDRGAPIPGVFVKDEAGQVVRTRLDPGVLQEVASGGGLYVHLGGTTSLSRVVQQIQSGITSSREESESQIRPIERFMWPLSFALGFLTLSHLAPLFWPAAPRAGGLRTLSAAPVWIMAFSLSTAVAAKGEDALFAGQEAFEQQEFDRAIEAYEGALASRQSPRDVTRLNLAIGAAAFRKGDFERAAEAYGQALVEPTEKLREHAHYNLGNTLFRQGEAALKNMSQPANPDQLQHLEGASDQTKAVLGQWESALEHYESALSINQSNERTIHNIEVVKKRIEELKKEQEKQEQEQEEQEQQEEEEQEEEDQEDEEDEEDEEKKDDSSQEGGNEEESKEENEDSGEQNPEENGDEQENPEAPDENSEDKPQDPSTDENESNGEQQENPGPQNPEGSEPEQPDAPQDGELEANPNQAQPQQMNPQEAETNPETGYAPSEARQLLEALADETEVRPVLAPSRGENYKNW
ncbi:MAG: VWA domain-containing protein [Verrucomicrobiales bacterium]|nr:VWA domain-containing protein [Verrucomicrobiales bacterium]